MTILGPPKNAPKGERGANVQQSPQGVPPGVVGVQEPGQVVVGAVGAPVGLDHQDVVDPNDVDVGLHHHEQGEHHPDVDQQAGNSGNGVWVSAGSAVPGSSGWSSPLPSSRDWHVNPGTPKGEKRHHNLHHHHHHHLPAKIRRHQYVSHHHRSPTVNSVESSFNNPPSKNVSAHGSSGVAGAKSNKSSAGVLVGGGTGGKRKNKSNQSNNNYPVSLPGTSQRPPSPREQVPEGEEDAEGYNSEDEYSHLGVNLTEEEWIEKDRRFERAIKKKGYVIRHTVEDGSCLFRAVSDQVYGDQEMHQIVRSQCMDYIAQNADYFSEYITEDIDSYVERKRYIGVHGNHLEIQALSEMFNRPIHIYCYSIEPMNVFQTHVSGGNSPSQTGKDRKINAPIRLTYHRLCHYNSLFDPNKPTVGVGLGLPGYSGTSPGSSPNRNACQASERDHVEKAMLEDKIKATDWEATDDAIQEQVARESYLQWVRECERMEKTKTSTTKESSTSPTSTATVTSGELRRVAAAAASSSSAGSPVGGNVGSPKACCSRNCGSPKLNQLTVSERDSPQPGCSGGGERSGGSATVSKPGGSGANTANGGGFGETSSLLTGFHPSLFGLDEWSDTDVLTRVLAASQQEYLDSLKKQKDSESSEKKDK